MDPEFLFAADAERAGINRRQMALRCTSGELIRVRPGVYVRSEFWQKLPPWDRDHVRIRAAVEQGRSPRILIQQSAAVIWGIPVIGDSSEILLLANASSHGRRRGELRWTTRRLLEPVTSLYGLQLTSRAQTVLDMAAYLPFERAVPAMDHVLRPDPVRRRPPLSRDALRGLALLLPDQAKRARALRVIDFADSRSESPGESYSRAVLHRRGFPPPDLQHEVITPAGRFRTDFYWKEHSLVGEFDGAVKYGANGSALPPTWDTLTNEKRREDAIRSTGAAFVRWSWANISKSPQDPDGLVQRLVRAGLPRSRRS